MVQNINKQRDKNVLGVSFWPPNTSFHISLISNININSTATSHHTPPPFQMERNHHQRPKRMLEEENTAQKKSFCAAIARPPIQKINIAIGPYSYTDTHLMLFGYTTRKSEQNWNQISLGILLNSILYLYCYLVDIWTLYWDKVRTRMLFIAIWFETHRRRHRGAFIESLGIISDRIELYFSTIPKFHAQSVINVLQLTCPVHVILHEDPLLPTSGCRTQATTGYDVVDKQAFTQLKYSWSVLYYFFVSTRWLLTELTKMNESSPIAWTRDWMNQ